MKPTLFIFGAQWCGPCKTLHAMFADPEIKAAMSAYAIAEIDTDADENGQAVRFGIKTLPTMLVYDGKNPVRKLEGLHSKKVVLQWLNAK
jgi:thioredoxin-like negative regulator of GroEL